MAHNNGSPRRERTEQFYDDVRKEYHRLRSIVEDGRRKYSDEWIRYKVAQKFYRSEATIDNIVFHRV